MINALALFLIGLLFIYNGLQMRKRRLRLGSSWGFRTEETQISEPIWRASHAVGGFTVMDGGLGAEIAGAVLLLFPTRSMTTSLMVTLCGLETIGDSTGNEDGFVGTNFLMNHSAISI